MVKINGKDVEWKEGATAEQYLLENPSQVRIWAYRICGGRRD